MIYWSDRLLWSLACLLAGLIALEAALKEYAEHGLSSPMLWFHALGGPAMIIGIVRAWSVR